MSQGHSYHTDDEILEGLRRNAPGAFEACFDRYADLVYGFSLKMTGSDEAARRVLQESFASALGSLEAVKSARSLDRWLLREATRSVMKIRQESGGADGDLPLESLLPAMQAGRSEPVPDWSLDPDEEARRPQEKQFLRQALVEMPGAYALVLVLHDMEEMSHQEIADIVQKPVATVKSHLHRARLYLRRELSLQFSGGDGGAS